MDDYVKKKLMYFIQWRSEHEIGKENNSENRLAQSKFIIYFIKKLRTRRHNLFSTDIVLQSYCI